MLYEYANHQRALLRTVDDFGFVSYDLVGYPRRLCDSDAGPPLVDANVDKRRVRELLTPATAATQRALPEGDGWLSFTSRTLARLYAAFLVAEDPQRRLDASKAATLMHQVSLVNHILGQPNLRKVLIGDEVGLGKTIEAGLIIRQLMERDSRTRVLYLAPARLVSNVAREFREKLDLDARIWAAGTLTDARLAEDRVVIASIHKAVFGDNFEKVLKSGPWDVLIVDECHHLSDWNPSGGKPNQSFRLVSQLIKAQPAEARLILMSGTPHQGSEARFRNILRLLSDDGKDISGAAGRVIFRTKDRVRDWRGAPLFPARNVRPPIVVQLGEQYERWYERVALLYEVTGLNGVRLRAAGWAKGQALQWAASSVQAGLGFLARLGIRRLNWNLENQSLSAALSALRPYRGGPPNEPLPKLFDRIMKQIGNHVLPEEGEEDEEEWEEQPWRPDPDLLADLLREGISLIRSGAAQAKWETLCNLIDNAGDEKIVLFAQPVETVTVVAEHLARRYGVRPALIMGNQSDEERTAQVAQFQSEDGPRFLVSSKAGGEGLNMQRARYLIHLDVPWNPMDLEQRIGRVHRFGSRKTIMVDTVVAAGSREVDMYRIAREKLAMAVRHLDPEQFEGLFSRVMSLMPPKELEAILGDAPGRLLSDSYAAEEIGRLVTQGFKLWSDFDQKYRQQAETIRAINPGEATWADLGSFLVRHAGASDGPGAKFSSFEFSEDEVVEVEQSLPTVLFDGSRFVCGDTGGLPAVTEDGAAANRLGINLQWVQGCLRDAFAPARGCGVAFIKAPSWLTPGSNSEVVTCFLVFIRQKLRQEGGRWVEVAVEIKLFRVDETREPRELDSSEAARIVRACSTATRVRDPQKLVLRPDLVDVERGLYSRLRQPSDDEIQSGTRYAAWPLALIAASS
jgi:superfamily II DNA or RNA helicase